MGQMYLSQDLAQLWRKFLQKILSRQAAEGDRGSLTRVSQVIEAGRKVCIPNETAGGGAGKV
jgi:hypothetical protein